MDIKPYGFTYITVNSINGKKYIGQKRYTKGWESYLGSGTYLKRAINKYGEENFSKEIIDVAYSREELNLLEIKLIDSYNACTNKDYYNIALGGNGGNCILGKTREEIVIIRQKIGVGNKLRYSSGGRISMKGKLNPMFGLSGESSPAYGIHHSAESRINQINALKMCTVKVMCVTTNKIFNSIKESAKFYNINSSGDISRCCKGTRKNCGKLEDGTPLAWIYL